MPGFRNRRISNRRTSNGHFLAGGFLVLLLVPALPGLAVQSAPDLQDQWPRWRGPLANGVAPRARPPLQWDEDTHIAWKFPLKGEGISTPIVWQNRVFLTSAVPTDRVADPSPTKDERAMTRPPDRYFQFMIECLDLETGEPVWQDIATQAVPHEGRHQSSSYAAASPVTDGQRVIVSFGSRGIFSYSLDGQKQWSADLGQMHTRRGWGEATSPVLVDDLVIVNRDNEDASFICALDAASGEMRWKVERDEPTTWATPLVIERAGRRQVVTNGTTRIVAYDVQTGEEVWSAEGTTLNAIPCPVEFEDNVICMAGYRGNRAVSVQVGPEGLIRQNWEHLRGTPYVPSPLLSENRLYFTQSNKAILNCLNAATGEPFFGPLRLDGLENLYGSPVAADGRVYLTSREGTTLVFRDAESFQVLATNRLPDRFDASPVPVGTKLLLRGKKHLYCIEDRQNQDN